MSKKCAVCGSEINLKEKPSIFDSFYGAQYLCNVGCWDAYEGWYCDFCLLLHDFDTTSESFASCQKRGAK